MHEWFSLKEAAHYLRVSRRTMYNLMDRGVLRWHEIPGLRGRWFKREDLDALRQPGTSFTSSRAPHVKPR